MSKGIKQTVLAALIKIMRPVVKILIKHRISYDSFVEFTKWLYVDVASNEFGIPGKKQTDTRISVITGLTRKEVKRLKEINEIIHLGESERYNRIIRVIRGWLRDPVFQSVEGKPKILPLDKPDCASFSLLVKKYSGDMSFQAILDEMLESRLAEFYEDDGLVRILSGGYIVTKGEIEKIEIIGTDVSELIRTINHNIESAPEDAFLQRKIVYDNIPENHHAVLKEQISGMGKLFLDSVNMLVSQYDRDVNPSVKGTGRKKLGLGIFYFED